MREGLVERKIPSCVVLGLSVGRCQVFSKLLHFLCSKFCDEHRPPLPNTELLAFTQVDFSDCAHRMLFKGWLRLFSPVVAINSPNYTAAISWNTSNLGVLRCLQCLCRLPRAVANETGVWLEWKVWSSAELGHAPPLTHTYLCPFPTISWLWRRCVVWYSNFHPSVCLLEGRGCRSWSTLSLQALSSLISIRAVLCRMSDCYSNHLKVCRVQYHLRRGENKY